MRYLLALDQSTSATKTLIYEETGHLIDKASLEHEPIYPQPGWVEHDAEQIWQNTLAALTDVLERNRALVEKVLCLSISNQRETIVVFDRETGRPLHNAIVWQCRRGDALCEELLSQGHGDQVRQKTGLKIDSYFPASKLKWLVRNRLEIAQRLSSGDALIGTIDTYLIYRLTNGKVFATDATNASRTLLFNIAAHSWDEQLCELFQVPRQALPEVRDNDARFGATDLDGRLDRSLPICGVMGDSQAALFAQRCFQPGMAKVTLGTGSSLLLNIGNELRLTESGAVTALAWRFAGQSTYAFEGLINYSAATIEWLRTQLELIGDASQTEAIATSVPDNGGVYLVPAFAGLSAPYWSPTARAAILGMTAHSTRAHIVRAALESIAYQIRDVLDMMKQDAGIALESIHADGGAAKNRFLIQFIADMVGRELRVAEMLDASPLGAALSGALGMGLFGSLAELAAFDRESTRYEPAMTSEEVERFYSGWKQAVQRLL